MTHTVDSGSRIAGRPNTYHRGKIGPMNAQTAIIENGTTLFKRNTVQKTGCGTVVLDRIHEIEVLSKADSFEVQSELLVQLKDLVSRLRSPISRERVSIIIVRLEKEIAGKQMSLEYGGKTKSG